MSPPLGEVYHLDPGLPCLMLLSCRKKWALTATEIRTRFSLRLSHGSDFSNFVRAKQERRGIDVIGRREVRSVVGPGEGCAAGTELASGRAGRMEAGAAELVERLSQQ